MTPSRYFFEISYNGRNYNGWQSQPNGVGIQTVVEEAFRLLLKEEISVIGSGRTDTGVHCEQQFFHVDIESSIDSEQLLFKLNSVLPRDIAINSVRRVKGTSNARYDAVSRTYHYRIIRRKDPFLEGMAWHFHKPLDISAMNSAAALLTGTRDFECFSKVKTDVNHFICDVKNAAWKENGYALQFEITANRFLRGMVRAIVGTLLDVGTGKTSTDSFRRILVSHDRREAGANVPAQGLFLVRVEYPESVFLPVEES